MIFMKDESLCKCWTASDSFSKLLPVNALSDQDNGKIDAFLSFLLIVWNEEKKKNTDKATSMRRAKARFIVV